MVRIMKPAGWIWAACALAASTAGMAGAGEKRGAAALSLTDDWRVEYYWKHAKYGMNVYHGHFTVRNDGDVPLRDVRAAVEVHDIVANKNVAKNARLWAIASLAPGASAKVPLNLPRAPKGDEFVVRLSAEGSGGGDRIEAAFSSPDPEGTVPVRLAAAVGGGLRLLAYRLETGKIGRHSTPATLYVKAANLDARTIDNAKITAAVAYTPMRKKGEETLTREFPLATPAKPLASGQMAHFTFKFTLPGEFVRETVTIEHGQPDANAEDPGNAGAPNGADEFADVDPDEEGLHLGSVSLEQQKGAWYAKFKVLNTFKDELRGPVSIEITLLDAKGEATHTYDVRADQPNKRYPRGKPVLQRIELDAKAATASGVRVLISSE